MGITMIGILIYQSHDYIQYISFLTFLWYYLWKEYLCHMVIGRNVYNGCTFCYDIGLLLPIQEERVSLHVCVLGSVCSSMCVCWHYVCMCLWFSGGGDGSGGRLLPIYVCLFFSHSGLFSYFFQIKALLIPEKDQSWFWTLIRNLLNCWQSVTG